MDVFESKPLKLVSAAFYIVLMFLSFYCACYRLPVGLKYAINLLIFGWACAMFFLRPMFNRAIFCLRFFALFFFPYLMFWMWSVAIWISEFQTFNYILRGSLNIFYMLTNLMFASAAIYLFGEATMPLTLVGMTMANGLVALQVAASAGIGTFISEYIRLLITFADDTGGAMRQMELHDMVYGWGVMLIYYAIHKEKNHKTQAVCFLISALFFTLGFKRIAVPAVFCAAVMYHILYRYEAGDYLASQWYEGDPNIRRAVDFLTSTQMLTAGHEENLRRLQNELIHKDWFQTLPDFNAYVVRKGQALYDYACDPLGWRRKCLVNVARAGFFSSDRTIAEYDRDIWHLGK